MPTLLLLLLCALLLGAATGYLFRFTKRGTTSRPSGLAYIGIIGGVTGFIIFQLLVKTTGAPLWLLPLLVVSQVWLWLGPFGPKRRAG
ncbi:hypothetical protein P8S55_02645 [Halomonas sp. M1]|uniref:hypothetical protein n=1 Tax=Halomonas sp. M1 TaxID=3035470 RepID=UPI0024857A62|nr:MULTISPECIES: hypothetical protein [unclassified Halomonas]MDP3536770.1 hypothetical protein [Halomonas sp.]WFE71995.1 hypothetical protein P8S55_02645 [Halomonas sp. M1]